MYQDPKGDCIDGPAIKNKTLTVVAVTIPDGSYYKSRIMSLNEEIMTLNKRVKTLDGELAMVSMH